MENSIWCMLKTSMHSFNKFIMKFIRAQQNRRCCTICFTWILYSCLAAHVIVQLHFLLATHSLENASRSVYVFHIHFHFGWFIFERVCVSLWDACVRACLRFIRLLTIRNITNGAKVTAFVYHYIATIFACVCVCV